MKISSAKKILEGLILVVLLLVSPHKSYSQELQSTTPLIKDVGFEMAVEEVAKAIGPTVVSIRTERTERYRTYRSFGPSPFEDDFFQQFFEDFFGELPERELKRQGLGSGVIIDQRGYILTNEHVVGNADKITVTLSDGREFKGELKGTDPRSDLAVIKIDAPNLPAARLGDSDRLKIGQWVVAIGNPFGHILANPEPTVSTGIVSALNRSLPRTSMKDTDFTDLIQTDAAINPGNSGGPLVNLSGEVIGINVAIFSTSGGYQGIGFAIPINTTKRIVTSLIEGKEIYYGWIGVSVQNIDRDLANYFGLSTTQGVLLVKVLEKSPAEKGGLQDGDIILEVDNKAIRNVNTLIAEVGRAPIGEKVPIKVFRDNRALELNVTVGKRPLFDEKGFAILDDQKKETQEAEPTTRSWRGVTVEEFTPQYAKRLRLPSEGGGMIIVEIEEDSPAHDAGLRRGDIILSINKKRIRSAADFHETIRSIKGDCLVRTARGYFVVKP